MSLKLSATTLWRASAAMCATGILLAGSCGAELQALAVGLDAAAQQLGDNGEDDDMNFGDWLMSELDD